MGGRLLEQGATQAPITRYQRRTPQAPLPKEVPVAQQVRQERDVGFDVPRAPAPAPTGFYPGTMEQFRRLLGVFGTVREEPLDLYKPHIPEVFQAAGQEVVGSIGTALGNVVSGSPVLQNIFAGRQAFTQADLTTPAPAFGRGGRNIFGPQEGINRSHRQIASFLSFGIRPPFIRFGAQEFLHITDDEMINSLGYVQVPGGWVRLPVIDQPLENVYGSGTAAQPQTVNVNYGGGGGGVGTRRTSSYLVNWRI